MAEPQPATSVEPSLLHLKALEALVEIEVSGLSPEHVEELSRAWSRCLTTPLPEVTPAQLSPSLNGLDKQDGFARIHQRLTSRITLQAINHSREELLLLHASGLAHDSGRVAVLAGRSGAGKTTACRHLGRSLGYVTDETIGIHPETLDILPYPKPLSLGPSGGRKTQASPEDLELLPLPGADLHLGVLILLDRDAEPHAHPPQVEHVPLLEAAMEIATHASFFSTRPLSLTSLAETLRRTGGAVRISYGEAATLTGTVTELLASPRPALPEGTFTIEPNTSPATAGIRRATVHDAIGADGSLLVHHGETVQKLDGLGPHIWRRADGITFKELVSTLIDEYGDPGDGSASAATSRALAELEELGLILLDEPSQTGDPTPEERD